MTPSDVARFMAKVSISRDGCWIWTGYLHKDGYPYFHLKQHKLTAARIAYKHFVGPLDETLSLHRVCGNQLCVNPSHLRPMSHVNTVRANGKSAGGRPRREVCKKGHPMTSDNVWENPNSGARVCRTCKREWRRNAKKRAKQRAISNR